MLRELEIDIAVDLKGHHRRRRPGIFAHRPAPMQVSYLGLSRHDGRAYLDYLIADEIVDPDGRASATISEKVVTLPGQLPGQRSTRRIAAARRRARTRACPTTGFVFCSFNNSYKITPPMFDVWMRLLASVPGQRALAARRRTRRRPPTCAGRRHARGVAPERLVFAPRTRRPRTTWRGIGWPICSSTRCPYNAHTTASDALWAGLPVLTCLGNTFAGRVAAACCARRDCRELVTESLADYEALAVALARDPPRLTALRQNLAQASAMRAVRHRPVPPPSRSRVRRDVGAAAARRAARGVRCPGYRLTQWRGPLSRPRRRPDSFRASR